ncbi:MAG TPA: histidine phosphatase family protein [Rhizomicrobium sp.]|jgi:broad specificity phosphatase PhoE
MGKLILIKHSQPVLDPDVPSPRWVLSDQGRARCVWLADALRTEGTGRLCSSLEPKALETAALVATHLGIPVEPHAGLEENDRTGQGFAPEDELRRSIKAFFERPADIVMGRESAGVVFARFSGAVGRILARDAGRDVAVVTHGTVLTLFVSRHNAIDPFAFWGGLSTPSYVVLDGATFALAGQPVLYPKSRPS